LSSIRVDTGKLDKLVNLVGGLITVEARLQSFEDTVETRDPDLAEELLGILDDSSRILRELQDQAMSVRMVPIGGAFDILHRLVRDYCRETGKRAGLTVSGQDTEVDKKVSEQISAPLKHIIRNALDHGIESPAERIAQGKPPEGQITLSAYHQYGLIVIQVLDDGRGINVEAVTQSARRRGIIDGSRELSQREALELIFAPSVSTAAVVTEVSGRGVGMDVVKRDIEALRGKIDVATEPGRGTTITLSIPQTLSIVECLVVGIGPNRYSIPLSSVEECAELASRPNSANGDDVLDLRGDLVPFLRLRELFDVPGTPPPHEKIVIVSTGQRRAGLVVDHLIGNHQAVIKPMSPLHRDIRSFLGATILGDGQVVLVLDVIQLIDFGQSRVERLRAS
jgi:two-component system chemotaxis sensor kinase CheA